MNFADTVASQPINIQLCSDAVSDPGETVTVTLSNPMGGASIGAGNPATINITDVPPPYMGTFNIPGDFTSLTNAGGAFDALNNSGSLAT